MRDYKEENIEWSQTWREDVNKTEKRVLLIGDSIVVGYRSVVNRMLEGKMGVTAYSTSKAINNPYYMDEIALLMKQEENKYEAIQFNNGLHGGGNSTEEYIAYYEKAVRAVMALCPGTPVILALSTPVSDNGDPASYEKVNWKVKEMNEAVKALGEKMGLPVLDLYSVVYGKPEIRTMDGYHYNKDGYELLGRATTDALLAATKA